MSREGREVTLEADRPKSIVRSIDRDSNMPMCRSLTAAAMQRFKHDLLPVGLILLGLFTNVTMAAELRLDKLHLPPGFHIEWLPAAAPNARQIALGRHWDVQCGTY